MANGQNVGTIIKQLEQNNGPCRPKPPVPLGKPSSSVSGGLSPCRERAIANSRKVESAVPNGVSDKRENRNCRSDGEAVDSCSPFCYVSPNAITKMGCLADDKSKKTLGPPPPPPPKPLRPSFKNDEEDASEGKSPADGKWLKVDDRWIPSTSSDSDDNNETDVHSENKVSVNEDCVTWTKTTEPESVFKKPDVPPRRQGRKSSEGTISSPLRPLPPLPTIKLSQLRKSGATDSVVSNSSVPSLSDDGDSDAENCKAECSSTCRGSSNTSQSDLPGAAGPKLPQPQKAFRCAEEFLTTEKSYVKTLEDLSETFPRYMKEQSVAVNKPLVEPDIPAIIAASLQPLREFHRILAAEFQKRLDNWDADPRLADLFLTMGHFLKVSIGFLQRKEELANQVLGACKRYPEFQAALTIFERQYFDGLHLVHKLDSVHQRLCRYPLLLSSYLKFLSPDAAEYKAAEAAKEFINGITLDLEKSLSEGDGTRKLNELYRRIVHSSFEVIAPGRKLLKEGVLLKHSRKEQQSRHLILFTDVLICCAPVVAGNLLRVGHIFWLHDSKTTVNAIGDVIADPDNPGWEFQVTGRRKSITFVAKGASEGDAWVKGVQSAITHAQRKPSETLGRVSVYSGDVSLGEGGSVAVAFEPEPSTPSDAIVKDLGRLAPVWTPDQRVTMCQCCASPFTVFRRRHHCRACGRVICDDCSGRAPLEYHDFKANRACPKCYGILHDQTKDKTYMEYLIDRTRLSPSEILFLFIAPKNGFRTDGVGAVDSRLGTTTSDVTEEDEACATFSGYLSLSRNGQQWKRYWTVMRDIGLLEFYKAVNDRTSETKIILVGWNARAADRDRFVFELMHANQFESSAGAVGGDGNLHYWLKATDADSMDRWLSALDGFFKKFAA